MVPPLPGNPSTHLEQAIQKLIQGREASAELQTLLQKPGGDGSSETAGSLVKVIMGAFSDTITMLNSDETGRSLLDPATTQNCSSCSDGHVIKDLEESVKIHAAPAAKDGRRGYKRRRPTATWTKVSPTPFVDDYGWRKYGQKDILGAKFPRNYFRCTHRNDQGCQATKQVQRMEDDPSNFLITYMGHHTCKDIAGTPQLILDSPSTEPFSFSFESNAIRKNNTSFFSSILPVKHEENEEIMKDFPRYNSSASSSSSSENLKPSDLSMFDSCGPVTKLPTMAPDPAEVFSRSSTSSDAFNMDMKLGPSEFDDVFCFDGVEFF